MVLLGCVVSGVSSESIPNRAVYVPNPNAADGRPPSPVTPDINNYFPFTWEPSTITPLEMASMIGHTAYDNDAGLPGMTHLIFDLVTTNREGFDFEFCNDLIELSFPMLEELTEGAYFNVTDCSALQKVSAPILSQCAGDVVVARNAALAEVNLSVLTTVGSSLRISDSVTLDISLPSLCTVGTYLNLGGNSSLASVNLPLLASVGTDISFGSSALTNLNLPNLVYIHSTLDAIDSSPLTSVRIPNLGHVSSVYFQGCALDQASVNHILAVLVAIPDWGVSSEAVNLSGGTSAAPSGQGATDVTTLTGRGADVITN